MREKKRKTTRRKDETNEKGTTATLRTTKKEERKKKNGKKGVRAALCGLLGSQRGGRIMTGRGMLLVRALPSSSTKQSAQQRVREQHTQGRTSPFKPLLSSSDGARSCCLRLRCQQPYALGAAAKRVQQVRVLVTRQYEY